MSSITRKGIISGLLVIVLVVLTDTTCISASFRLAWRTS